MNNDNSRLNHVPHRSNECNGDSNARSELLLRSESPYVQQMLLYQMLDDDIKRRSQDRVRYMESDLHFKHLQRTTLPHELSSHEIQSATLNIGLANRTNGRLGQQAGTVAANTSKYARRRSANGERGDLTPVQEVHLGANELEHCMGQPDENIIDEDQIDIKDTHIRDAASPSEHRDNHSKLEFQDREAESKRSDHISSTRCQVCLVKELRQDLMNLNKVIQERNEHMQSAKLLLEQRKLE